MAHENKKEKTSSGIQARLHRLEGIAMRQGIQVHYDRLEAAGLKLKGGVCKIRGEYHLFIDKRKPLAEKLDLLTGYLQDVTGTSRDISREGGHDRSHPRHKGR